MTCTSHNQTMQKSNASQQANPIKPRESAEPMLSQAVTSLPGRTRNQTPSCQICERFVKAKLDTGSHKGFLCQIQPVIRHKHEAHHVQR